MHEKPYENVCRYEENVVSKWKQRFKDNDTKEDDSIKDISDSELSDRLYDHLLSYNGPMLGNFSFWGMVLEALIRLKKKVKEQQVIQKTEEIEDQKANIVGFQPRVITGGKGPPETDNWLLNTKPGSVFLCKPVPNLKQGITFAGNEFHVVFNTGKSVRLMNNMNGPEEHIWITDPVAFCNTFRFVEFLYIPEE